MCTLHYREKSIDRNRRITRNYAVLTPCLGIPEKKADLQAAVAPSGLKCNYNFVVDDDVPLRNK
jgi:hypothetical protein